MKSNLLYMILIVGLFVCLAFDIFVQSSISYLGTAYFVLFCILSTFLIIRGLIYKIDSNVYFGILLLLSPIIQTLIYFEINNYAMYCCCSFAILSLASLVAWKYFKDERHKIIFFIFSGEIVVFLLPFCLTKISFWYLIILAIVWCIFVIVAKHFKPRKKQPKKN